MKKVTLFHFESCPYCLAACRWIQDVCEENAALQTVEIVMIDERLHADIARQHDYWSVPTFYMDEKKVHEGVCTKEKVLQILKSAAAE